MVTVVDAPSEFDQGGAVTAAVSAPGGSVATTKVAAGWDVLGSTVVRAMVFGVR